jgi:transcriptional regulator with XRE-family HTH domain
MKELKTYAERLAYALKLRNISQRELAKKAGMKPQNISYLCKEGQGSSKTNEMAAVLKVNARWLESGKGDIEPGTSHDPIHMRIQTIAYATQDAIEKSGQELSEEELTRVYKVALEFGLGSSFSKELIEQYVYEIIKNSNKK